jgi:dGTP triphosphohydrolase
MAETKQEEEFELKFENNTGLRIHRRPLLSIEKMKTLLVKATDELSKRQKQVAELEKKVKQTKDDAPRKKLLEQIYELRKGISVKMTDLETYFGTTLSNSDNFAWLLSTKNTSSSYKQIVDDLVVGKILVGAHYGSKEEKSLQSVSFRLPDKE